MAEAQTDLIDEFVIKNKIPDAGAGQGNRNLLSSFAEFLKSRGQLVSKGDLKKELTEVYTVKDRNKVPIEVAKCLVCGHETFEVLDKGDAD